MSDLAKKVTSAYEIGFLDGIRQAREEMERELIEYADETELGDGIYYRQIAEYIAKTSPEYRVVNRPELSEDKEV